MALKVEARIKREKSLHDKMLSKTYAAEVIRMQLSDLLSNSSIDIASIMLLLQHSGTDQSTEVSKL